MNRSRTDQGFAFVTVLIAVLVLSALALLYVNFTLSDLRDTRANGNSIVGFYAAEGGLNTRAEAIRSKFVDYNRPSGTSPSTATPCTGSDTGSGDFLCNTNLKLGGKNVVTYVVEPDPSGTSGTVGAGEKFAGLNYLQYAYQVYSEARNPVTGATEAKLKMEFQSRLVPLFQFAAFYNDDLEILPSPKMTLTGRVHTNKNLYLQNSSGSTLTIDGKITTGTGDIYRGRKNDGTCSDAVNVKSGVSSVAALQACSGGVAQVTAANIARFNGYVQTHVGKLTVPELDTLDPKPSSDYFAKADLRIVAAKCGAMTSAGVVASSPLGLPCAAAPWVMQVRNADNSLNVLATLQLNTFCAAAVRTPGTATFYDKREKAYQTLMEVDEQAMMNCINNPLVTAFTDPTGARLALDDSTGNGLVWNFSFDDGDPDTNSYATGKQTKYGVRVRDAATLGATSGPAIKGLTIVTNQPAYLMGDFNKNNKKPASVLADSLNILSNAWTADPVPNPVTKLPDLTIYKPTAADTVVNAAFLAGTDITQPGQYNGGLENYPRFHESWSGKTFTYRGSFVSLGQSAHAKGTWPQAVYDPPQRDWDYDSDFNDASKLPPLAPRFVYLRQLLFARSY